MIQNPRRSELTSLPFLNNALDLILAQWHALFSTEHDEDGHHTNITATSLTTTGDATVGGDVAAGGDLTAVGDVIVNVGTGAESGIGLLHDVNGVALLPADLQRHGLLLGGPSIGMFLEWRLATSPFPSDFELAVWHLGLSTTRPMLRIGVMSGVPTLLDGGSGVSLNLGDAADPLARVTTTTLVSSTGLLAYGRTVADGEWQDYTPAWTAETANPALGNGTIAGRYSIVGDTVTAVVRLTMGSTTTFGTGPWILSLPLTSTLTIVQNGYGLAFDASTGMRHVLYIGPQAATTVNLSVDGTVGRVEATNPFTWTTGDLLRFTFIYEAA